MKESDARKKWCPMVRYNNWDGTDLSNRPEKLDKGAYCLGSDCMAWRWILGRADATQPRSGYCGLAGNGL